MLYNHSPFSQKSTSDLGLPFSCGVNGCLLNQFWETNPSPQPFTSVYNTFQQI